TRVSALAEALVRQTPLARLKVPAALLLAGCLLAAGFAVQRAADPPPTTAPEGRPSPFIAEGAGGWVGPLADAPDEAAGPWPQEATRPIKVSGRVLDPAGRPFAGARLYVGYAPRRCDYATSHPVAFPVRARSAADGWFDFTFAPSDLDERY